MTTSAYEELTEPVLQRLLRPGDYHDDPLAQSIPKRERYAVHAAMKKLSPYHHKLLTLRYLQGYDMQRTAQELLISPAIVTHHEQEAIASLRAHLPQRRREISGGAAYHFAAIAPVSPPVRPQPQIKTRVIHRKRVDREAAYIWLDAHPGATITALAEAFKCSPVTAVALRSEWRALRQMTPKTNSYPKVDRAPIFAWLETQALPQAIGIVREFQVSKVTAQSILREWRLSQTHHSAASPACQPATLIHDELAPTPEIAVMPTVETPAPPTPLLAAPRWRLWYEEQVIQAQALYDVLREQEHAAQAYLAAVQSHCEAAEERLRQAEQIAAQWRTRQGGSHAR